MKLFIDDLRMPQDDTWIVARTVDDAITLLKGGRVTEVSFDHDLADTIVPERTGYTIAYKMVEMFLDGDIPAPQLVSVHSANPVGRERIKSIVERYIPDTLVKMI